ncbi:DUF705 domain-containing protein [Piscinibacterium candidicorallinum]|uniref:DUF705 domain-containing protein n=1 Tax=Piscinibacterium candidicorallinum TaxID=1793872 RepID=A0ABV7H5U3_9BURK
MILYVDVDDTLIRSVGAKRIPMPGVVSELRRLHAQGAELYLWSSGGAEYARQSAIELGIEGLFVAFLPKPTAYIDDQPVSEWRQCVHVYPSQAQQLAAPNSPDAS